MLSSQDEACKLGFRSERIPYHSVHSHSFFFQQFYPKKGWKNITVFMMSPFNFSQKSCFFFRGKKIFAHVNVGYCLLISVIFHLSRLKYCF